MEKGQAANNVPQIVELEEGKRYAWCSCGKSESPLWCNGAHSGSEFRPAVFISEETKNAAICTCKQTSNPPYCDGSHKGL